MTDKKQDGWVCDSLTKEGRDRAMRKTIETLDEIDGMVDQCPDLIRHSQPREVQGD